MTSLFKRQVVSGNPQTVRVARKVLRSRAPSVLQHWNRDGVALALWDREFDKEFESKLDQLSYKHLPRARFLATAAKAEIDVSAALADTQCFEEAVLTGLSSDIESLITRFAKVTGSEVVEVRLEAMSDDGCRLFHADRMRARLVTTYRGPGTEWVENEAARDALADPEGFSGPIQRMPRFSVGLFPGSLSHQRALVHRSPRIEETRELRLFLCINEARVKALS